MAVNGEVCIFRMTNSDDTEDTILEDKIEMEGSAVVPDALTIYESYDVSLERTVTRNPAPFRDENVIPDTGFGGNSYSLRVIMNESAGVRSLAFAKLVQWISEPNSIPDKFHEGRFGIRNNYRPEMDLVPDLDHGYKISNIQFNQEQKFQSKVIAVIKFDLSGGPGRLRANVS